MADERRHLARETAEAGAGEAPEPELRDLRSALTLLLGPASRLLERADLGAPLRRSLEQVQRGSLDVFRHLDGLPQAGAEAGPPAAETALLPDHPKIVVVEDDASVAGRLVDSLAADYRVVSVRDGARALARAAQERPDLVLTDAVVPGMEGETLVRSLLDVDPDVAVLVLTSREDEALRVRLLEAGAADFVTKPVRAEEIRVRVRNLVSRKRALDLLRSQVAGQRQNLELLARDVNRRQWELRSALEHARVARDLAEEASRTKSNFLRMMSHELRTPVTAMQLQLTLLQRIPEEPLGPRQAALAERLTRSTRRLLDLIESALEYARVESGRYQASPTTFDLGGVVRHAVAEFRSFSEHKQLSLLAEVPELPPLASDEQLVRLITLNLVGNALKHTEAGGVVVAAGCEDDVHYMEVRDTGPGMTPEDQEDLFDPFRRAGDVRSRQGSGSGLGLTIVSELVRAVGGRISVRSQLGRGTTLRVLLPPMPATEPPEAA